jgi:hypothetical protein
VFHTLLLSLGSMTCRTSTLSVALCLVLFEVGVESLDRFEVLLSTLLDGGGVLGPSLLCVLEPQLERLDLLIRLEDLLSGHCWSGD